MFANPAIPDRFIVSLDIGILLWFSWLNVINPDSQLFSPVRKFVVDKFRTIVTADCYRFGSPFVKGRLTHAILATQLRDRCTGFGLFEDHDDWLSVNFDVFIMNLQRLWYEKILLLTSVNLRDDYRSISESEFSELLSKLEMCW